MNTSRRSHVTRLVAFVASVALAAPALAQNLLTNGNLDATSISSQVLATPTGWTVTANRTIAGPFNDGASSEAFANVLDPGGQGLFFKPFTGSVANGNVSVTMRQTVPATPGLPYTLTGWAGAEANYVGLSNPGTQSLFRIEFLDAGNNVIDDNPFDLRAAGLGVGAPTPPAGGFAYHPFSFTEIAPAGTASVRVGVEMLEAFANPAGGGQAFVVDAFSLVVPEPSALGLAAVAAIGLVRSRRRA